MIRIRVLVFVLAVARASAQALAGEPILLNGHKAPVLVVAIAPDGKTLVSAAAKMKYDRQKKAMDVSAVELKVWDLPAGKERAALEGFAGSISALAFAPDGKTFASASGDLTAPKIIRKEGGRVEKVEYPVELTVWETATCKKRVSLFAGQGSNIKAVAFALDGKSLASGSGGVVKLWDLGAGKEQTALKGHAGEVFFLAFTSDGKTLVSAAADGVRLWDTTTGKETGTLKTGPRLSVALSPDGKTLAISGSPVAKSNDERCEIKLWDVGAGKERALLRGHNAPVQSLAFTPDGKTLASAGNEGIVKLWDLASAKERGSVLEGESGTVYCVRFSHDGNWLVAGSYDGRIRLWDTAKVLAPSK